MSRFSPDLAELLVRCGPRCAENFRNGALQDIGQNCDFDAQFEEARCRLHLRLSSSLCDGAVQVDFLNGAQQLRQVPSSSQAVIACSCAVWLCPGWITRLCVSQETLQNMWCVSKNTQAAWCSGQ